MVYEMYTSAKEIVVVKVQKINQVYVVATLLLIYICMKRLYASNLPYSCTHAKCTREHAYISFTMKLHNRILITQFNQQPLKYNIYIDSNSLKNLH